MDYSNEALEMINDNKFMTETALGRKMTQEMVNEKILIDLNLNE